MGTRCSTSELCPRASTSVITEGLEPPTARFVGECSNPTELRDQRFSAESRGFEPHTPEGAHQVATELRPMSNLLSKHDHVVAYYRADSRIRTDAWELGRILPYRLAIPANNSEDKRSRLPIGQLGGRLLSGLLEQRRNPKTTPHCTALIETSEDRRSRMLVFASGSFFREREVTLNYASLKKPTKILRLRFVGFPTSDQEK